MNLRSAIGLCGGLSALSWALQPSDILIWQRWPLLEGVDGSHSCEGRALDEAELIARTCECTLDLAGAECLARTSLPSDSKPKSANQAKMSSRSSSVWREKYGLSELESSAPPRVAT